MPREQRKEKNKGMGMAGGVEQPFCVSADAAHGRHTHRVRPAAPPLRFALPRLASAMHYAFARRLPEAAAASLRSPRDLLLRLLSGGWGGSGEPSRWWCARAADDSQAQAPRLAAAVRRRAGASYDNYSPS